MTAEPSPAAARTHPTLPVVAGVAVLLAALVAGAATLGSGAGPGRVPLFVAVLLAQAGALGGWLRTLSPPAPIGVAIVAAAAGVAADGLAAFGRPASLAPLAAVLAIAVIGTLVAQLVRGVARVRVTEAMAATLTLTVVMAAYATLLTLFRQHSGPPAVIVYAAAAGTAVLIARLVDGVIARPRVAEGVARGGIGIALGAIAGTAAAAGIGVLGGALTTGTGALIGAGAALAAVLIDLAVSYGTAAGTCPSRAAAALGPLLGFAAGAPVAYVLAILVLA